jgi:FecR protein
MTDRRPPENGEEADLIVERVLSDALMTSPLEEHRRERLRNAVMKEWRAALPASRTVMWATRGWWLGLAAAASLVAVTLAILLTAPVGDSALFGSVVRLNDGGIDLRSGWFRSHTLQVADALRVGQHLTVRGSALVTLPGGGTLRIGAGSSLYIVQATELSLERGLIYVDTPPALTPSNPLRVATVAGVIEHLGTQFEVMSDSKAVRIRVREGKVRFSSASGALEASAGTELLTMSGGQVAQQTIPTYGRDWLWTAALAPDYDIEGRSLMGFLQWASRELGRPLDFADMQSRDVAGRTILHGSVRGQEPLDALGNVLATTTLTYELRGATIWVHSAR